VADADGRLALPLAPELMPHPAGDQEGAATLAAAAAASGGRVVADPRESLDPRGAQRQSRLPLRRPLLLAAAILFVADVALRRIRIGAIDSRR
jgi:hypothetical protein